MRDRNQEDGKTQPKKKKGRPIIPKDEENKKTKERLAPETKEQSGQLEWEKEQKKNKKGIRKGTRHKRLWKKESN